MANKIHMQDQIKNRIALIMNDQYEIDEIFENIVILILIIAISAVALLF